MRILDVSQANETDAWLQVRRGKITGTKAKDMIPEHYQQVDSDKYLKMALKAEESAAKARTEAKKQEYQEKADSYREKAGEAELKNRRVRILRGWWLNLAEKVAEEATAENPADRGHRLEPVNISLTLERLGTPQEECVFDTGMWVRDDDDRIAISPDAHEDAIDPTWAIECKSLGSTNHLTAVVPYLIHKNLLSDDLTDDQRKSLVDFSQRCLPAYVLDPDALDIEFIPQEYQQQVIQYFVVCDTLETVYFSMYDDRCYNDSFAHVIMTVKREDIQDRIESALQAERQSLKDHDLITDMLSDWSGIL